MPRLDLPAFRPVTSAADLPEHVAQFMAPRSTLLRTPALQLLLAGAHHALTRRRIVVIDGPAGCGKSLGLAALSAAIPGVVRTALVKSSWNDRATMAALHEAVTGLQVDTTQHAYENRLRHALSLEPLVLAIDEAENATLTCLRTLRHLIEAPGARFAAVLCGTGISKLLANEPMLASWTGLRVTFPRFAPATLRENLAVLHPQMSALTTEQLASADKAYAAGCLRNWVVLIEWMSAWRPDGAPFTETDLRHAVESVT